MLTISKATSALSSSIPQTMELFSPSLLWYLPHKLKGYLNGRAAVESIVKQRKFVVLPSARTRLGEPLLVATKNRPRDDIPDITTIPSEEIDRVYKMTDFSGKDGICNGMTDWFIAMYLRTKQEFASPRTHARAVGSLFTKGGTREAVLLQNIRTPFQLELTNLVVIDGTATLTLPKIFDPKRQDIAKIASGIYKLLLDNHACAFININKTLSCLFDPNFGVIEIKGNHQEARLRKLLQIYKLNLGIRFYEYQSAQEGKDHIFHSHKSTCSTVYLSNSQNQDLCRATIKWVSNSFFFSQHRIPEIDLIDFYKTPETLPRMHTLIENLESMAKAAGYLTIGVKVKNYPEHELQLQAFLSRSYTLYRKEYDLLYLTKNLSEGL